MRKKLIRRITIYLLIFLLFCTAASAQVQRRILPQVTVAELVPGTVETDGVIQQYDYTMPSRALTREGEAYYLYYVAKQQGKFGEEQIAVYFPANVVADDGMTAALSSDYYGRIIVDSDKALLPDQRVMVRQQSDAL